MEFPEKYINPLTDFGFKKLFGEEVNIDLLDENSLKYYRDIKNVVDTAYKEGEIKGMFKVAKKMKMKGFDTEAIIEFTGLTAEEIEKL